MKYRILIFLSILLTVYTSSCKQEPKDHSDDQPQKPVQKKEIAVEFNQDSAYHFVEKQVSFGPRVPGTAGHSKTIEYLQNKLSEYCDTVFINHGDIKKSNEAKVIVNNIIGSFNPSAKTRIVLAAHYDTRPHADEDFDNPLAPADGANDGGSGVGVLLEIARQLKDTDPGKGVDIIFFDQEDGGDRGSADSWCLGSQFWGQWAQDHNYVASWGILLDMVGAKGATFAYEGHSIRYNQSLMLDVWRTGQRLGYSSFFLNINGGLITDDHVYMNMFAQVPSIDIIHHDLNTNNGFPDHWHKLTDNMDAIDKSTLKAVGHTVLHVVMNRK